MKKIIALLLAVMMVLAMAACAAKTTDTPAPAETDNKTDAVQETATEAAADGKTELNIGVLVWKYSDTYGSSVRVAMDKYAKEIGAEKGLTINLEMQDGNDDQATQNNQADVMFAAGKDHIIINLCDTSAGQYLVDLAKQYNVPISFYNTFASASALRALWAEGGAAALAPYVPQKALKLYKQAEYDGKYTDFAVMGHCELALLRAACTEQAPFAAVRGVSEGLEHRLENAVRETASLPALLDALTTVRYPRARMRRLAMDAALGYTAQTPALPPYLHLLGARKETLPLPGETALPLSHSLARLARENETCAQMAAAQSRASDLGALCRAKPEPMGGIYRQKIIFLTN